MTAFRTGRSRSITISGTFGGYAYETTSGKPPLITGNSYSLHVAANWITDNATYVDVQASALGITVEAVTGLGARDTQSDLTPRTVKDLLNGTWSITISQAEEWAEYVEADDPADYGGAAVSDDPLMLATLTLYERVPVGAKLTVTVTCGNVTATAVDTFQYPFRLDRYDWGLTASAGGGRSAQDFAATWDYLEYDAPTSARNDGHAWVSIGGRDLSIKTDTSIASSADATVSGAPPQGFDLIGQLRADAEAYTAGGTVRVKRKSGESYAEVSPYGGSYSASYVQRSYGITCTLNGVAQDALILDEQWPWVYHWFVPPSGEQSDQWRLLLRGPYYLAGTIGQSTTVALDGGFSFGSGGTTRTCSPAKSLAGYRYLLVQTDQPDKQVTLTIGVKTWTVRTDGSGLATFDLCVPSNLNTQTDARDSRWPVPTDVDTVTGDGAMWGVVNVGSYTLAAEAGVTCAVGANGVYLSRDTWASPPAGHSLLNVVAPHLYWVESGVSGEQKRPFLRGDTDGRRSLEEADYSKASGIYMAETIGGLFAQVNAVDAGVERNPGWTATLNSAIDVPDGAEGDNWYYGFLNKNRNAMWLEGAGISYRNGAWSYGLDLDVSSARDLYAQVLIDKVSIYPMCGDALGLRTGAHRWEYGSTADEGRITLAGGRYMRGASWGLVAVGGKARRDSVVTLTELPASAEAGAVTTDVRGEYLTGSPCGRAGYTHRTRAAISGDPAIEATVYCGTRLRRCFAAAGSAPGAIERASERGLIHVGEGEAVTTYSAWGDRLWTGESLGGHVVGLAWDSRTAVLWILTASDGDTLVYRSDDCGLTATEVLALSASSAAIESMSDRAVVILLYAYGGSVYRRVSVDSGQTWGSAEAVADLSPEVFGLTYDPRTGRLWATTSGGLYTSEDCGASWVLVG